jgi:hypothetical protein
MFSGNLNRIFWAKEKSCSSLLLHNITCFALTKLFASEVLPFIVLTFCITLIFHSLDPEHKKESAYKYFGPSQL